MPGEASLKGKIAAFVRPIASFIDRMSRVGTEGYPPDTIQRLRITNLAAYLIVIATTNYIILYAAAGAIANWNLVLANLVLVGVALSVPQLHRFDDHAGFLVLIVAEFILMFYLMSEVGREAGVQLNYIGFAAGAFLGVDHSRIRTIMAIIIVALILSVTGWFLFPDTNPDLNVTQGLIDNIYVNSVLGTVGIVSFIIYYAFTQVNLAKAETDRLLRNILPGSIAERLKAKPDEIIADSCEEATVLFADLVGFTPTARKLGPSNTVKMLNDIFTRFDKIADEQKVEKIKTIGDAYMVVAGLPDPQEDHTERLALTALRMVDVLEKVNQQYGVDIALRIGIETGPVMAGVIGRRKFFYDVWGDTVNMAARLESHGEPGRIHVSEKVNDALKENFSLEPRGTVALKGVGKKETWFLNNTT